MECHSTHEPTYQLQDDVENLEAYSYGGYHPVQIGDLYSDHRYRIVHKLGFGSYSTVWLAQDLRSDRYVAMKIIVAGASEENSESCVLKHLQHHVEKGNEKDSILPVLLDEIWITGPNGKHRCLVTDPAGCNLADSKEKHPWKFPIEIARAIAAQAIIGLRSIHRKGVVHGDLHMRNILFALPQIDGLPVETIYDRYHTPRETPVHRVDGRPLGPEVPPYTVMPAQFYVPCTKVHDPRIRIADFGEAWINADAEPKTTLFTPAIYLPPETTFAKHSIDFPADVWTLACSMFEIFGDGPLFEGFFPDRDDIIAEMVSCLGPLPQHWWDTWQAGRDFFVDNGVWRTETTRKYSLVSRPLTTRIQEMGRQADPKFSAAEAESVERLLFSMLQYEPAKRATAEELVESEWMLQWGLPAMKAFNISV
ncbi:MAG: hypothetical protein Q9222_002536 [Ikaeria aurantiellina]